MLSSKKYFTLSVVLLIACCLLPCFAEEAKEENNINKKDVQETKKEKVKKPKLKTKKVQAWNEILRLQDFYVLPEIFSLTKERRKEYRETLKKEYTEHPDVFSSAIAFGLMLIDMEELDKADVVWERALKDFRRNDTPVIYNAWLKARQGEYLQAQDAWYPIAKEKFDYGIRGYGSRIWLPYHVDSVLGLYLIEDQIPEEQKKERYEEIVLEIARNYPNTAKLAAITISEALKEGRLEDAGHRLAFALESAPEDPVLITLLGISQLMTKHYDLALKLFDKSIALAPTGITNRLMKARTLYAMKKKKEALEEFDLLAEANPKLEFAAFNKSQKKEFLSPKSYLTKKKIQIAEKNKNEEKKEEEKVQVEEEKDLNKAQLPRFVP